MFRRAIPSDVFDKAFEKKMVDHFDTLNDLGTQYFAQQDTEFKKDLDRQARTAAFRLIRRWHGLSDV